MIAIHLKCEPEGIGLKGLTHTTGETYRSCCWDVGDDEANALVGGWIYFHHLKSKPSVFGGRIFGFERVLSEDEVQQNRVAFNFEPRREGKGQFWRGQARSADLSGGIVEANLAHEKE